MISENAKTYSSERQKNMTRLMRKKRIAALLLAASLILSCLPFYGMAAEESKTIRVGYIDYKGFINEMSDGSCPYTVWNSRTAP